MIYVVVGVVLGCQPIISYNMGAKKYDRVRELYRKIFIITVSIGLFFTAIFELFPDVVIRLFGVPSNIPNPEAYWRFGEKTLRIFLSFIAMTCVIKMNSIFFQAVGKPMYALVASIIQDVVCFTPLMFILPCLSPSVELLLWAAPISDIIAITVTAFLSVVFLRSLKNRV